MGKKWYAVQKQSSDDWDTGSFDFEEAKAMLKKQGFGLIAVIVDDFCEEEIEFDDLFYLDNFSDDELAEIVANTDNWENVEEHMELLCNRAGEKLRDMEDSEEKQELIDLVTGLDREHWDPILEYTDNDVAWWLRFPKEINAGWHEIALVLQKILGVSLV